MFGKGNQADFAARRLDFSPGDSECADRAFAKVMELGEIPRPTGLE